MAAGDFLMDVPQISDSAEPRKDLEPRLGLIQKMLIYAQTNVASLFTLEVIVENFRALDQTLWRFTPSPPVLLVWLGSERQMNPGDSVP